MRVWIINHYAIPPSMGGLVRHYYFSKYLHQMGHEVRIFTASEIHNTNINMIRDGSLYKEETMDGVPYTFLKTRDYTGNGLSRIYNMLEFPLRIQQAVKKFVKNGEKPDVIYTSAPTIFAAGSALIAARRLKVPCVVEVRDIWPESIVEYKGMSRKNPIILVLYQLEKWLYKHADRLIFTVLMIFFRVPYTTVYLLNFFQTLSKSYEEAAAIDGCSPAGTFWRIMFPLVQPALVTVTIFNFLGIWNEFFMALIFASSQEVAPVGVGLLQIVNSMRYTGQYGALFAAVIIVFLPTFLLYIFLSEKIIAGVTGGGVKG